MTIQQYDMKRILSILFTAAILSAAACSSDKQPLPSISGRAGELIVVATKAQWEGEPGNALREALGSDFGYLPQDEPRFDLMLVPKAGVNRLIKTHRNMLYLNVADTATTGISIRRDVWSSPQMMVIVSAPDEEAASELIRSGAEKIAGAFENAERERNMMAAKAFEVPELREKVCAAFGGSPYFPEGYSLKKQVDGFVWISHETSYTIQGIFIYSFPCNDGWTFDAESLAGKRNETLKRNVPATAEGSYMITNPSIVPGSAQVTYNGIARYEIRSLWDTYNDFMGGPFVSQAFTDRTGENVIVVEGFVYAPKYDKRDYLRQVEGIISTFHWDTGLQQTEN